MLVCQQGDMVDLQKTSLLQGCRGRALRRSKGPGWDLKKWGKERTHTPISTRSLTEVMWRHMAPVREKMRRGSTKARAMAGLPESQVSDLFFRMEETWKVRWKFLPWPSSGTCSGIKWAFHLGPRDDWGVGGDVLPRTNLRHTESLLITEEQEASHRFGEGIAER